MESELGSVPSQHRARRDQINPLKAASSKKFTRNQTSGIPLGSDNPIGYSSSDQNEENLQKLKATSLEDISDSVSSTASYSKKDEPIDTMPADSSSGTLHRRTLSPDGAVNKRSNKPLMEKRRRQRFNQCLSDLKKMVLEALKKDPSRYTKLEKVEILQMALRYVQYLQRQEVRYKNGFEDSTKFRAGFSHCTAEVSKILGGLSDVSPEIQNRVIAHLTKIGQSINSTPEINTNTAFIQNRINVSPPQTQVIFLTVPNTQTLQVVDGNSLGVAPQIAVMPTISTASVAPSSTRIQIIPSNLNNLKNQNNSSAVYPERSTNNECYPDIEQPYTTEKATNTPILNSLLTPNKSKSNGHENTYNGSFSPSSSSSCYDSAIGTDVTDISDSDFNSPISSPSCSEMSWRDASSPEQIKQQELNKPIHIPAILAMTPKMKYRESLNAPLTHTVKRPPLIAPKPEPVRPSVMTRRNVSLERQRYNLESIRQPQNVQPQNVNRNQQQSSTMWRPW